MNTDSTPSAPATSKIAAAFGGPLVLGCFALIGIGILAVAICGFAVLGWTNRASSLQNSYEMKVKDNGSEFDNMWKKIQQSGSVVDSQKEAFKQIFESYAGARSGNGGGNLATLVKEAVPNIDLSSYNHLMNIVTGSRDSWTMRQKELVSIAEQYNNMLVVNPSGFILKFFGYQKIDPKVITSARTEDTFATGQDNDVTVFPKATSK